MDDLSTLDSQGTSVTDNSSKDGTPAPEDIFTDNHRWGDLANWNEGREARSLAIKTLVHIDAPEHKTVEFACDPETMKKTFVGGHKTSPIRYSLR